MEVHKEVQKLPEFEKYPDFYENYKPSLPFANKKLEFARAAAGQKQLQKFNYAYYLNKMQPVTRTAPPQNQYHSVITDELNQCSLDMAVKIQEIQLQERGFSPKAVKGQIAKSAIKSSKAPVFNTISEKI